MSSADGTVQQSADPVETLLGLATPRPLPPQDDAARIRAAVREDWQAIVAARRRRSRYLGLGIAATVLLCVSALTWLQGGAPPLSLEVAQIETRHGSVQLVDAASRLVALPDETLRTGDVIQTGPDGGIGLRWRDSASLRIGENTRVRLAAVDRIRLEHGRLYFDSEAYGDGIELRVETAQGFVRHVGTRYMTEAHDDRLVVSVRSGLVRIDGRYYDAEAPAGRQVTLNGRSRPATVSLPAYGAAWAWTERLAAAADMDGRSLQDFLGWVAGETGYRIAYASDEANRVAATTTLKGVVEADPLTELKLRLMTADLGYDIDRERGEIVISTTGRGRANQE